MRLQNSGRPSASLRGELAAEAERIAFEPIVFTGFANESDNHDQKLNGEEDQ